MKFVNRGTSGTGNVYNVTVASGNRHTGSETVAGANSADLVKNIYDLEGNMLEVTAELIKFCKWTNTVQVSRGGSHNGGSANPASFRSYWDESDFTMRL